ncbi:DUF397 domain-containing protein [Streptomyces sp. NPDC059853]|uniref:DUF397 domain-containing protein n=1 Tax=Streptomyces sp. NPDC059853 TaxID=3346973 RepID=UPI00364EA1E9
MSTYHFRRSSYSTGGEANLCVEVATNVPSTVAVRDSKRPAGPVLHLSPAAWTAFLATATVDRR